MRKVRAWDSIEQQMWEPILRPDGRLMMRDGKGGFVTFADPQDLTMFSVGREDKNGEDIFEEDLVRTKEGVIGVVKWDQGALSYYLELPDKNDYAWPLAIEHIEVIGNTYKNYDLIMGRIIQ